MDKDLIFAQTLFGNAVPGLDDCGVCGAGRCFNTCRALEETADGDRVGRS